jgi:predicted DNA-binding transcriptional regulator YafY
VRGNTRELFRRVVHLHRKLRAGRSISASLEARSLEVHRRTVSRDLELLRGLGAPLVINDVYRWHYVEDWSLEDAIVPTVY